MASTVRKKVALKGAVYAFVAGAHYVTEEVERAQSMTSAGGSAEATETRQVMLEADYERFRESTQMPEVLIEMLNEEDLYPFGDDWPLEAVVELLHKLVPPKLSIGGGEEADNQFKFKKGFKDLLKEYAEGLDAMKNESSSIDHWLTLILNASFYAGVVGAARNAENSKLYFDVVPHIEDEQEPWTKYPQLAELLDLQLSRETRRKTGLVSDFDDY